MNACGCCCFLLQPINFIAFYIFVVEEIYFSSAGFFFFFCSVPLFAMEMFYWMWFLSYALCPTHKHIRNVKEFESKTKQTCLPLFFVLCAEMLQKISKINILFKESNNNRKKKKFKNKKAKKEAKSFTVTFFLSLKFFFRV